MSEIIITEFMDQQAVDSLQAQFDCFYDSQLVDKLDEADLSACRVLIVRNRTQVGAELLAKVPKLEIVGRLGVGLDNIDLQACSNAKVRVFPATGANAQAVAEYVIASAMILRRQAFLTTNAVLTGGWPRQASTGAELSGATLGLIGYGGIARLAAEKARALGMRVIAHDPYISERADIKSQPLNDLLQQADVLSLHVPLTDQTRNLINADRLGLMKTNAVLINTARGGVVDEAALAGALKQGQIAGAALDVFENEPFSTEDGARFKDIPSLILTPHIAGVTDQANARVSSLIADIVGQHMRKETPTGWVA